MSVCRAVWLCAGNVYGQLAGWEVIEKHSGVASVAWQINRLFCNIQWRIARTGNSNNKNNNNNNKQ